MLDRLRARTARSASTSHLRTAIVAALCLCALAPSAQAAAPPLSITSPTERTGDSTPDLAGGCDVPAGLVFVSVTRAAGTGDAQHYEPLLRPCVDGSWVVEGYAGPADATFLEDDSYQLSVTQIGDPATVERTFVVDTQGPAYVEIYTPAPATNDPTPLYQGRAADGEHDDDFVSVRLLSADGQEIRPSTDENLNPGNENSFIKLEDDPLADGSYILEVVQRDDVGNATTATHAFTVDTAAPAPTLDALASPTRDVRPTISGTAGVADGDLAPEVRLFAGSDADGTPLLTFEAERGEDGDFATEVPQDLADGTYTVRVDQADQAENAGSSTTRTFLVDATPPDVTISSPADGGSTTDSTPTVAGSASTRARDLATVEIRIFDADGEQVGETYDAPATGGEYAYDVPALRAGTFTVVVIQRDTAGNTDTAQRSFTVVAERAAAAAPAGPAGPAAGTPASPASEARTETMPTLSSLRAARRCPITRGSARPIFEATTRGATSIAYVVKRAGIRTPQRCASSPAIKRTFGAGTVFREVGRGGAPVQRQGTARAAAASGDQVTRFGLKRSIADRLRPGTYRVSVVARNADGASRTLTYAFRVLATRRAVLPVFTG